MFSSSTSAATPTMRRGLVWTPMNFITGSVHIRWRLSASDVENIRCARLWLTMTTDSPSTRSASVEVAARDDRHAERGEEPGRDGAEACARGSSSPSALRVALGGELEARAERAGLAPRHDGADRDPLDAGQLGDAPHHLLVERRRPRLVAARTSTGTFSARTLRVLKPGLARPAAPAASSAACRRRPAARTRRRSASRRTRAAGGSCRT